MYEDKINEEMCRSTFLNIYQYFEKEVGKGEWNDIKTKPILMILIEKPAYINFSNETKSTYNNITRNFENIKRKHGLESILSLRELNESLQILTSILKNDEKFLNYYFTKYLSVLNDESLNFKNRLSSAETNLIDLKNSDDIILKKLENSNTENSNKIKQINIILNELKQLDANQLAFEVKKNVEYIRNAKKQTEILIGNIAENKNAGKYKEYYEKCRKSARGLFWFSLSIMVFVAVFVGWHLWNIETLESAKLLIRIPMAFLVLLPSFFMMREAKKLKDKEFQYHDIMCRIVTSAPYIDGLTHLDDNQKDQMKADLVKDFFARPIECRDDGGLVPIEEICKIVKMCAGEK